MAARTELLLIHAISTADIGSSREMSLCLCAAPQHASHIAQNVPTLPPSALLSTPASLFCLHDSLFCLHRLLARSFHPCPLVIPLSGSLSSSVVEFIPTTIMPFDPSTLPVPSLTHRRRGQRRSETLRRRCCGRPSARYFSPTSTNPPGNQYAATGPRALRVLRPRRKSVDGLRSPLCVRCLR